MSYGEGGAVAWATRVVKAFRVFGWRCVIRGGFRVCGYSRVSVFFFYGCLDDWEARCDEHPGSFLPYLRVTSADSRSAKNSDCITEFN